jgi:hypothetical protein
LDDYFDAVEITWIKDEGIRERVKKMLNSSHLTVAYYQISQPCRRI